MNCKNFLCTDPHWSKKVPDIKSLFVSIGPFQFGECGDIKVSNHNTYGYVILDAVNFAPKVDSFFFPSRIMNRYRTTAS